MHRLNEYHPAPLRRSLQAVAVTLPPGVLGIDNRASFSDSGLLRIGDLEFPLHGARIVRDAPEIAGTHRCIAGPYYRSGGWMLHNALLQLRGCRDVAIVEDGSGISIYRPGADPDVITDLALPQR